MISVMEREIAINRVNRKALEKILLHYPLEKLNEVPQGFTNNVIWNIAHVVITQQLLIYKLSGLPMHIDANLVDKFKKGTKTEAPCSAAEVAQIKELLFTTLDQTILDLKAGKFTKYNEYPTSTGFVLQSIEDAFSFNTFHEGIHLGYILALKKAL